MWLFVLRSVHQLPELKLALMKWKSHVLFTKYENLAEKCAIERYLENKQRGLCTIHIRNFPHSEEVACRVRTFLLFFSSTPRAQTRFDEMKVTRTFQELPVHTRTSQKNGRSKDIWKIKSEVCPRYTYGIFHIARKYRMEFPGPSCYFFSSTPRAQTRFDEIKVARTFQEVPVRELRRKTRVRKIFGK